MPRVRAPRERARGECFTESRVYERKLGNSDKTETALVRPI